MWEVEYYTGPGGRQPVAEWLDKLDKRARANLRDKILRLQRYGLMLLNTSMMKTIKGYGSDFYELKHSSYRIAIYCDSKRHTFILLHGFEKKRQRETAEIKTANLRLREFCSKR